MNAASWLAVAVVLLAIPRPSTAPLRSAGLVRSGRWPSGASARPVMQARPVRGRMPPAALGALVLLTVGVGAPPTVAAAGSLALAAALSGVRRTRRTRAARRARRDAVAAVRLLAAELRSGSDEAAAVRSAAAVAGRWGSRFRAAGEAAERGQDVAAAFTGERSDGGPGQDTDRDPGHGVDDDPGRRIEGDPGPALAAAWRARTRCGAGLADVIERVEHDLTTELDRRRSLDTALAGPRSSVLVLAGLPVVGLVMGAGIGARPIGFLLGGGAGSLTLLGGVGLQLAGLAWTRRIVSAAQR